MKYTLSPVKSLATLLLLSAAVRAADPAPTAVPLADALKQLTADDYQTRQSAGDKVNAALAQNIHEMLSYNDPESLGRIAGALEYNAALSRWALDVLKLPAEQRAALATWGTTPQVAPLLARIYGKDAPERAKAIAELAQDKSPNVNTLLAKLIRDEDAAVRNAAIAGARTRPADPAVIEALWGLATGTGGEDQAEAIKGLPPGVHVMMGKAIARNFKMMQGRALGGIANVVVQGNINGVPFGNIGGQEDHSDDSQAVAALIAFKDPSVAAKVRAYFQEAKPAADVPAGAMRMMFGGGGDPAMQNVLTLAEAYKVTEVIPHLMKTVTDGAVNTQSVTINGTTYCTSNRTDAMAAVCLISGQKPEDYKLTKAPELNAWTTPDAASEGAAADKLTKWFQSQPAATQPASPATAL
jgi:hypothetical protein